MVYVRCLHAENTTTEVRLCHVYSYIVSRSLATWPSLGGSFAMGAGFLSDFDHAKVSIAWCSLSSRQEPYFATCSCPSRLTELESQICPWLNYSQIFCETSLPEVLHESFSHASEASDQTTPYIITCHFFAVSQPCTTPVLVWNFPLLAAHKFECIGHLLDVTYDSLVTVIFDRACWQDRHPHGWTYLSQSQSYYSSHRAS